MKIAIATLGCKVNQYESAAIIEAIGGGTLVPFADVADYYIINTCAVTVRSEYQSRQLIRRAIRTNPKAKIIVTGCYAQIASDTLKKIDGISAILGNPQKELIPKLIAEAISNAPAETKNTSIESTIPNTTKPFIQIGDVQKVPVFDSLRAKGLPNHTRATLKIQDGCNAHCTYCVIPLARGKSRSMPPADVLQEIATLASLGYKETVFTGIHLGAYGEELQPQTNLATLLKKTIISGRHTKRIRLSSIEPREIDDDLLAIMAAKNSPICPHLHIPLQSGDDEILARMNRNYSAHFFEELINNIVAKIPDIAIGIDVIVGFPTESDAHFANTRALIEKLPIAYCHIFPYSPRAGTVAALIKNDVDEATKKQRGETLRLISDKKREAFGKTLIGKTINVLIEGRLDKETKYIKGLSGNYQTIIVKGTKERYENRIIQATVELVDGGRIIGTFQRVVD